MAGEGSSDNVVPVLELMEYVVSGCIAKLAKLCGLLAQMEAAISPAMCNGQHVCRAGIAVMNGLRQRKFLAVQTRI
jgi:hypothetical protein